ncbi:MAG: dimethylsulfonioproprionate lyase family protein [Pseudomonadota bacterium]
MTALIKQADLELRDAIQAFVAGFAHPDLEHFKPGIAEWSDDWQGVSATRLPAADFLAASLASAPPETKPMVELLARHADNVRWEQTYTKADTAISDKMLASYGFVEVIGSRGPFVSEQVRSGIGVYGPDIGYPPHQHKAEEIYIVLAGGAEYRLDGQPPRYAKPGDLVFVPSMLTHGFYTGDEAMVVYYIWQAGDLREVSTFV